MLPAGFFVVGQAGMAGMRLTGPRSSESGVTLLDLTGYPAAALTTVAYVPQVVKAWRSGSTRDLSVATLAALTTGLALWLAYGIGRGDAPLIAANAVTLGLAGTVLALKLKHG